MAHRTPRINDTVKFTDQQQAILNDAVEQLMEAGGLAALTQAHFNEAMKIVAQRFINAALQGELEHHLTRLPPPRPAGRSRSARQMPFFCPFWRWVNFYVVLRVNSYVA